MEEGKQTLLDRALQEGQRTPAESLKEGRRRLHYPALPRRKVNQAEGTARARAQVGACSAYAHGKARAQQAGRETGRGVSHGRPKMQHVTSQEGRDFGLLRKGR